jgi:MFS family permease
MATVERALQRSELRTLAILGVPTFALALGITTVSTYLPVVAEAFSDSSIVVGLLIGGEGLMALWLPLVIGSWSDALRTPIGSRLPFILGATPPLVAALALLGFVHSIAAAAIVVAVFFVGYFIAYEPYRALYPDLVARSPAARRPARRSSAASARSWPSRAAGC